MTERKYPYVDEWYYRCEFFEGEEWHDRWQNLWQYIDMATSGIPDSRWAELNHLEPNSIEYAIQMEVRFQYHRIGNHAVAVSEHEFIIASDGEVTRYKRMPK